MERLTTWRSDNRAAIANNDGATPLQQTMKIPAVIDRLSAIEDILGDDYDLDMLREIMEANRAGRLYMCKDLEYQAMHGDPVGPKGDPGVLDNEWYKRASELMEAERDGRCFIAPFVAMVEQSLTGGEMKPQRDQRFNGRYAVVYFDKEKWAFPLIDICGKHYDRKEAEERMKALTREAAEAALKGEQDG